MPQAETSSRLGDACAIYTGVATHDDMLTAKAVAVSEPGAFQMSRSRWRAVMPACKSARELWLRAHSLAKRTKRRSQADTLPMAAGAALGLAVGMTGAEALGVIRAAGQTYPLPPKVRRARRRRQFPGMGQ